MRAYERFLQYVTIPTQSAEGRGVNPSTACQWKLLRQLAEEMRQLGLTDVSVSEFGVVMGHLPATQGLENAPAIGFLAPRGYCPGLQRRRRLSPSPPGLRRRRPFPAQGGPGSAGVGVPGAGRAQGPHPHHR